MSKITTAQLNPTKSTDANGWTKYDYGTWQEYRKRVTFSQTIAAGIALSISSTNLPVGISTVGNSTYMNYTYTATANAYALSIIAEVGTGSTALNFTTCTNDLTSRAYSGNIDIIFVTT